MTERINRRQFLQVAGRSLAAIPLISAEGGKETAPLTDLPILHTQNTPIFIENLTRGGRQVDATIPGNEMYSPEWMRISNMPFDILTPIRPEPNLEVPAELEPQGSIPWVADIPHVIGLQPTLLKAVVGYSDSPEKIQRFIGRIQAKNKASSIISTHAFTDRLRIYPSKIYNILTVLSEIAAWQKENGPFMPGQTYSYLEMSGAPDRNRAKYLIGGHLEAGGICATVTDMSKTIYLASSLGFTQEVMRFLHEPNIQYSENPQDPGITKANSDATVSWVLDRPANYPSNGDYKFKLVEGSPSLYFSFRADTVLNEIPINPKHPARHRVQPADARIMFTISLTKIKPGFDEEIERLLSLREEYSAFHNFNDGFKGGFIQQP